MNYVFILFLYCGINCVLFGVKKIKLQTRTKYLVVDVGTNMICRHH